MDNRTSLGALRLGHKFLILSLIAVILASIPTWLYMREAGKALDAYLDERVGMPAVVGGLHMVQLTQQHRGLAALRPETSRVAPALRLSPGVRRRDALVGGAEGAIA